MFFFYMMGVKMRFSKFSCHASISKEMKTKISHSLIIKRFLLCVLWICPSHSLTHSLLLAFIFIYGKCTNTTWKTHTHFRIRKFCILCAFKINNRGTHTKTTTHNATFSFFLYCCFLKFSRIFYRIAFDRKF